MLRNAVDHGIEDSDVRVAAGKPATGTVWLSARHQGGEVWITVQDDGGGLDAAHIHKRAVERHITSQPFDSFTEKEIFLFIFEPGFSTAEVVSDISGRGMGMDVVRRNIDSVSGKIDVQSEIGTGTTLTLRIPLTLAVIEGMLVRVGSSYFTIPLLQIMESLVPDLNDLTVLNTGAEIVKIRDHLVPVLRMHQFYDIEDGVRELDEGILVVVEDGSSTFCLFVDELVGQRQTVIKALSGYVGNVRGLSGCTVMGDGSISLILDVAELQTCWSQGAV